MKVMKLSLVIVSFFLFSSSLNAQSVGIGIKGGLNFAKLSTSETPGTNYNNRTGYHGGAYVLFKLGKIGIQPEVLFSKQGSTVSFNGQDLKSNYNYVNIPVLLKLYTVAGINLQVGPQIGFLAGGEQEVPNLISGGKTSVSVGDYIKKNDFSVAMGLGWDLPFGLSIDGRYNLGLSNNNNSGSSATIKNQVIMISVGYRLFKIGK